MQTTDPLLAEVTIYLYALDYALAQAWREAFKAYPKVQVLQGDILSARADALVSPANSFGFMDGGLDLKISMKLGWEVERRVRAAILAEYDGELPVGGALIVSTDNLSLPWLICAPTMRVPMDVSQTVNAFLAFRGILRALRAHNKTSQAPILSIACPGLGTGEGRMPPRQCAHQMVRAYEVCVCADTLIKGGLAAAVRDHLDLLGRPLSE